jgi:hypothetical protein
MIERQNPHHQENIIHIQRQVSKKVDHHFISTIDEIKYKIAQEKRGINFPKEGENFSQECLLSRESYDQNEMI